MHHLSITVANANKVQPVSWHFFWYALFFTSYWTNVTVRYLYAFKTTLLQHRKTETILLAGVKAYFMDVGHDFWLITVSSWPWCLDDSNKNGKSLTSINTLFYCIGVSCFDLFSLRLFVFFKVYQHQSWVCVCILSFSELLGWLWTFRCC